VKEMQRSGLDKYLFNPDKDTTMNIIREYVKTLPSPSLPKLEDWTSNLDLLPKGFCYSSIVEYLVKRDIVVLDSKSSKENTLPLPTAAKPLVKGYNFFASGHVGEIMLNPSKTYIHFRTAVLASMRDTKYDVKLVLENKKGLVVQGNCKCPAGTGGKCNHIAALLFALVDYVNTMRNPDCCTNKPQTWHKPTRKNKKATHPQVVGKRKVQKHVYGRTEKRKRPLHDYSQFQPLKKIVKPDSSEVVKDLKNLSHKIGLEQVLMDTTSDSESDKETETNLSPEEIVIKKLQVYMC